MSPSETPAHGPYRLDPGTPVPRRWSTVPVTPVVAMLLVIVLLGVFLILLDRKEAEEDAVDLIKNVLWVEQNLSFQLASDEDRLRNLADRLLREGADAAEVLPAMRHVTAADPAIVRLIWLDREGQPRLTVPPAEAQADAAGAAARAEAFHRARLLGARTYGQPYPLPEGGAAFDLVLPLVADDGFSGAVVGVFSVSGLLGQHVPWWFTERYRIEVTDSAGTVLGAKSRLAVPVGRPSHTIPFDPPGHGLALVVTALPAPGKFGRNALVAAIFAVSGAALWSLWALRRHIRRRVAAEEALRAEHAFRKAMEDSLTVGMRARDLTGRVTYVNPAFCRMVGWTAEEMVGAGPAMPYWVPEERERTEAAFRAVMAGEAPPDGFELRFQRRNGERFDALIYEAPLIDARGRHTGWMGSVLDITERKRAEALADQERERLRQTARLIAMGEMASTLAHELNQPLAAIAGYSAGCLNLLRGAGATPAELEPALEKLAAQARRAGTIIRRVHDFVRKREPEVAACDLAEVAAESVALFEAEARRLGVGIDQRIPAGVPAVKADRILLQQVMVNLLRNGCEAMAGTPPEKRRLVLTMESEGHAVTIGIRDHGCGIAPEAAEKLFTPFFTTKAEGMGMGLNICRSIVEHHGGQMWFEAADGGGTSFAVRLPAADVL